MLGEQGGQSDMHPDCVVVGQCVTVPVGTSNMLCLFWQFVTEVCCAEVLLHVSSLVSQVFI